MTYSKVLYIIHIKRYIITGLFAPKTDNIGLTTGPTARMARLPTLRTAGVIPTVLRVIATTTFLATLIIMKDPTIMAKLAVQLALLLRYVETATQNLKNLILLSLDGQQTRLREKKLTFYINNKTLTQ